MRGALLVLLLAALSAGCAGPAAATRAQNQAQPRQMLNEGYSLLYADTVKFDLADLILYVKVESDAVEGIIKAAAKAGGEQKKDLEKIARDYPGVRIDLDPLPEMEKRKRKAIVKDHVRNFAPVVGRSGRAYERTLLIGLSNAFNHERHLCQVMALAEPEAGLRTFLNRSRRRYDGLYDRVVALLEKEYFRNPNGKSKN